MWESARIREGKESTMRWYMSRLLQDENVKQYKKVQDLTEVPWFIVACIHSLESSFSFSRHLHNGDPLTAKTYRVPKNHPPHPPANGQSYSWIESASDALGPNKEWLRRMIPDWSLESCLYFLERYNGPGYFNRGIPSPYLWSFTNHYEKGLFYADHKFDPGRISKQAGACALLLAMKAEGVELWRDPEPKDESDDIEGSFPQETGRVADDRQKRRSPCGFFKRFFC